MVQKSKEQKVALTLREIADEVNGRVVGDPNYVVTGISTIQDADSNSLTFLANPKYRKFVSTTRAGAILINEDPGVAGKNFIVVDDPYLAFAKILAKHFYTPPVPAGISKRAIVSENAVIGENVTVGDGTIISDGVSIGDGTYIYPGVFISENSRVGKNALIYPGVIVRENSIIGDNVIIQPGVVIGGDGFGFVPGKNGHFKIPQLGNVVIEDDVEIGANTTIDRGAIGSTVIGKGTKIDNLVQIGHNVTIGKYCLIAAQVGIAGSTKIGNFVMIGGQAGIAGHLEIGDGVQIAAKSGINASIPPGEIVGGIPAVRHRDWLKIVSVWKRLPQLWERVKKLEDKR